MENVDPNKAPDVFYVPEKLYAALRAKVVKGAKVTNKDVDDLVHAKLPDDEMYIPVDMNGAGEDLDDFDQALKTLGAKKAAQCFMAAHMYFEDNKDRLFVGATCPTPITAKEWKEKNDDGDDDADDDEAAPKTRMRDIFYVPEKLFSDLRQKLSSGKTLTREEVDGIVNADLPDDEMCIPVDMQGTNDDLDDFDEALDTLGPKKTIENFIQALEHFDKFKHEFTAEKLPKPMTSKEWKEKQENDSDADGEGEEEEAFQSDEDSDAEGDDAEEPLSKKAKKAD